MDFVQNICVCARVDKTIQSRPKTNATARLAADAAATVVMIQLQGPPLPNISPQM